MNKVDRETRQRGIQWNLMFIEQVREELAANRARIATEEKHAAARLADLQRYKRELYELGYKGEI